MKKLTALLLALSMSVTIFASCGKNSGSGETEKEKNVAVTDTSQTATKDSAEVSETPSSETEATESTDADKPNTSETAEKGTSGTAASENSSYTPVIDPATKSDPKIVGTWIDTDDESLIMIFTADGKIIMTMDMSALGITLKGNSMYADGQAIPFEYDGKNFSSAMEGISLIEMKRVGGKSTSTDGEYELTGGYFKTAFSEEIGDVKISVTVKGETLILTVVMGEYIADGKRMELVVDYTGTTPPEDRVNTYEIKGDTMTIVDGYGETSTMKKVK